MVTSALSESPYERSSRHARDLPRDSVSTTPHLTVLAPLLQRTAPPLVPNADQQHLSLLPSVHAFLLPLLRRRSHLTCVKGKPLHLGLFSL
jgi:hypothetical protein